MSVILLIVLQNNFEPLSEENFFQIKAEYGILIQKFTPPDSNTARGQAVRRFAARYDRLRS